MISNAVRDDLGDTDGPSIRPARDSNRPLVVVVDDQATGRKILERVIHGIEMPLEVFAFGDGATAMDFMRSNKPDLIVTDYLMPEMDGVSFIRGVRTLPGCADVPIIVVTIVEDKRILYQALDAGATDFLRRPIDHYECQARCRNLLALRRRSEQLRRLTSHLTVAEQRERRRLAMVVHDELQQLLVGAAFSIERAGRRLEEHSAANAAKEGLNDAHELVQRGIEVARNLTADLSPPILHEAGLPEALEWLVRNLQERSGLTVALALDRSVSPRSEDVRSVVFDVVRTALLDTLDHANCSHAKLMLSRGEDGRLEIVIETRAAGFDRSTLSEAVGSETDFGLLSMRERLEFLGGSVAIEGAPDDGFRLILCAPLDAIADVDGLHTNIGGGNNAAVASTFVDGAFTEVGIRVLVVDDHQMIRQGLSAMLLDEPGLMLVGEACDGLEAIEQVGLLTPDVVLMDFSMPKMNGLDATRRIVQNWPSVRVIGLSMYDEADRAAAMLEAGACAYLNKTVDADALLNVIRTIGAEASGG